MTKPFYAQHLSDEAWDKAKDNLLTLTLPGRWNKQDLILLLHLAFEKDLSRAESYALFSWGDMRGGHGYLSNVGLGQKDHAVLKEACEEVITDERYSNTRVILWAVEELNGLKKAYAFDKETVDAVLKRMTTLTLEDIKPFSKGEGNAKAYFSASLGNAGEIVWQLSQNRFSDIPDEEKSGYVRRSLDLAERAMAAFPPAGWDGAGIFNDAAKAYEDNKLPSGFNFLGYIEPLRGKLAAIFAPSAGYRPRSENMRRVYPELARVLGLSLNPRPDSQFFPAPQSPS